MGKVLTAREQHYFYRRFGERLSRADSDNGRHWKSGNEKFLRDVGKFLCGRWAAKEAIVKACTWRRLTFSDIQIRTNTSPTAAVAAARELNRKTGKPRKGKNDLELEIESDINANTLATYGVILDKPAQRGTNRIKGVGSLPLCAPVLQSQNSSESEEQDANKSAEKAEFDAPVDVDADGGEAGQVVKISISHDGEYATAVCLACMEPRVGDVGGEAAAREVGV